MGELPPLTGSIKVNAMTKQNQTAMVLFSGGQDSTVCLAWALKRFQHVETVGFNYGQRHIIEMDCRQSVIHELKQNFPEWAARLGPDHVIDMDALGKVSATSLTRDVEIKMGDNGLPTTFVPGRNILFLTFAAALSYRRGAKHLVTGVCETDYSGYPDCRDDTIKALQVTLNLAMEERFVLHTPLMWIDKQQTWQMAQQLGGTIFVDLIIEKTHSCYLGNREKRHHWGYGCGTCPACELRRNGFDGYKNSLET